MVLAIEKNSMVSAKLLEAALLRQESIRDARSSSINEKWFEENDPWFLEQVRFASILEVIRHGAEPLSAIMSQIWQGISSGKDGVFYVDRQTIRAYGLESEILKPLLKGQDVNRYRLSWSGNYVIYPYDDQGHVWEESHLKSSFPNTYRYLVEKREELSGRGYFENSGKKWYELWNQRQPSYFSPLKIVTPEIASTNSFMIDREGYYANTKVYGLIQESSFSHIRPFYILALLNSQLLTWYFRQFSVSKAGGYFAYKTQFLDDLPIVVIKSDDALESLQELTSELQRLYLTGDYTQIDEVVSGLSSARIIAIQDFLSFLAEKMIELNRKQFSEAERFHNWLTDRLQILSHKGKSGIQALAGYTIMQNYLGDYQKGEQELPWSEMEYRLHRNRSRFKANWQKVKGEVQTEYEKSLEKLRPIKQQLAETDALIDKIVYKLYGLTEEEIALIEQPQYEQALQEAKQEVVADKKLQKDPEKAAERMAEKVLPAAQRLLRRVEHEAERERLDRDLPGWHLFPGDVPTFLLTGEYNIRRQPEHLDFSTSVVSYAKAVETVLFQRLFVPFRDQGQNGASVRNKFLRQFVDGSRHHLTLGSMKIILSSSKEQALRAFALQAFPVGRERLFGDEGLVDLLNDEDAIHLRNKAAHDEVLTRDEAGQARQWAIGILGNL